MTAIDIERTDDDIVPEADADGDAGEPAAETTTSDAATDAGAADEPPAPPTPAPATGERWPHRKPVLVTLVAVVALVTAFAAGYGVSQEQSDGHGGSAANRQGFDGARRGEMGGPGHDDRGMQGERGSMQEQRGGER